MAKSVLEKHVVQSNVNRNAFDVGYSNKFTSSLGLLLPCFVRECNPDEHYKINPRMFTRTMPMNSAAFIQCTQHIEFFFVPYRLLWRDFPQFIVGTKYHTSLYDQYVSADSPTFDISKIYNYLKEKFDASVDGAGLGTDTLGFFSCCWRYTSYGFAWLWSFLFTKIPFCTLRYESFPFACLSEDMCRFLSCISVGR